MPDKTDRCKCGGTYQFDRSCGARVCHRCGDHKGFARCFCGWNQAGDGRGRQELVEMGETIDPEE